MTASRVLALAPRDIDRMMELEVASFDPSIQASRETILERMALGHTMYGIDVDGVLAAAVCFSYARFDPHDRAGFVSSEDEFSTQPPLVNFNAAFIYSRGVHPAYQHRGLSKILVSAAMSQAKRDGCAYAVGNPRTASYAGSETTHESIPRVDKFRAAIDRHLAGGAYPDREELVSDPSLLYFSHLPGCNFHWIIPNFAPHDTASGGIRVIVYVPLDRWNPF